MKKILIYFGILIRGIGTLFFALVVLGLFYESWKIVEDELVIYALITVTKICVVIGGALVFAHIAMFSMAKYIDKLATLMDVNLQSVMGLMLSLISGAAMLPMLSQMDRKGKLMNSAFTVMGAYAFGGQMAFVAGIVNGKQLSVYIIGKLTAGIASVILVMIKYKLDERNIQL
ncbi:MAG: ethanolamine utilization protein EutH, partial [Eubacteriales bacterium]|nr:ethanolamine utilization protein EutH [Eubacteriales bacterium]